MRSPTVSPAWLRKLAELVERGEVAVIRCDLRTGGIVLGVVRPDPPDEHAEKANARENSRAF